MNKGGLWPAALARWVSQDNAWPNAWPPCWAGIQRLAVAYVSTFEGIPVIYEVHEADCTIGQWQYHPSFSAITWGGTWDNGFDTGGWGFVQSTNDDGSLFISFGITLHTDIGDRSLQFNNVGTDSHDVWDNVYPSPMTCPTFYAFDLPWLPICYVSMIGVQYDELRLLGIDPNIEQPITWFGLP